MVADGRPILKVRVAATAADGAANAAVIALVARSLKLSRSSVRIAAGHTARVKRLDIEDVDATDIAKAFPGAAPP